MHTIIESKKLCAYVKKYMGTKMRAKTPLNYPPHPPTPASRHPAQALHIPADYQLPEHSDTSGNLEWSVSRILPDCSQSGGCSHYSG